MDVWESVVHSLRDKAERRKKEHLIDQANGFSHKCTGSYLG